MALDATPGGIASNSYLTVAEADALANADIGKNARAWLSATAEDKERALMRAATDLDFHVGGAVDRWAPGDFVTPAQALRFPRVLDVLDDEPIIPDLVRWAAYAQASFVLVNADLLDDAASRRARGMTNFSNPDGTGGSIADSAAFGAISPRAERFLSEILAGSQIAWIVTT